MHGSNVKRSSAKVVSTILKGDKFKILVDVVNCALVVNRFPTKSFSHLYSSNYNKNERPSGRFSQPILKSDALPKSFPKRETAAKDL